MSQPDALICDPNAYVAHKKRWVTHIDMDVWTTPHDAHGRRRLSKAGQETPVQAAMFGSGQWQPTFHENRVSCSSSMDAFLAIFY
ncbi:hypothetical protein [Rhizobium sp. NZLR4b]|uniref:hypothetical protein n=1 Tax=Rhizobium sp. NZLR4b TaxID=2731102 RepID=UPI001C82A2E2|nr:hypothetical protein [Rhizobium sp. NZLR4b]MBX5164818.1 hypothetical protein [Rhizobium sp. NZLR4b]